MASIQDLLAAAQRPRKSPFISLLEGAAQGFGQAQAAAPEQTRLLMLMDKERAAADRERLAAEQDRADRERAAESSRQALAMLGEQQEQKTQEALGAAGAPKKSPHPGTRLARFKNDKYGYPQGEIEIIEPKTPDEPKTFEALLVGEVRAGKMTLEDALKKAALERGGGPGAADSPSLAYQKKKDADKAALDLRELQIPGYQLAETGVRPTQTEAQRIRDAVAGMETFSKGIDRMVELIKEHGSTELTGKASGEMGALAARLKLTLKEVDKLGVLSATDFSLLESQVFDPSSIKSVLTRGQTAIEQLETTKRESKKGLEESLRARGYAAATPAPAVPPPAPDGGDKVPPAAPVAKAATAAGNSYAQTATNPRTGERIGKNPKTGKWERIQ